VVLRVVLVLVEVAGGSIDTAMNAEASHRLMSSPKSLVRLHALFNTGALSGAAIAAPGHPRRRVLALGLARHRRRGTGGRRLGPRHRSGYLAGPGRPRGVPAPPFTASPAAPAPGRLLALLVVFALAEITEGGVDTWGVLYLRNHLATGVLLGAGAYVVGQLVAATTRGAGGTCSAGSPPAGPSSPAAAWPAPASFSSRSPRIRASPPSGWRSAPAVPRCSGPSS
jgi:hypothetical protein